jgi:TonB family protein
MLSSAPLAQVFRRSLFLILLAQVPPQSATPRSQPPRIQLKQDELCCFALHVVNAIYPREARLAHTEGVVKLTLVIAVDGSVADLQPVSGVPLLLDSAMEAVRQWRFTTVRVNGGPIEAEVPLSFTFKIEDPPKPAYLHLTNGKVIRADEVREFTDRIEYTVDRRTHHIPPSSVTDVNACASVSIRLTRKESDCISGGGPSFIIRAIPLLPAAKTSHTERPALN